MLKVYVWWVYTQLSKSSGKTSLHTSLRWAANADGSSRLRGSCSPKWHWPRLPHRCARLQPRRGAGAPAQGIQIQGLNSRARILRNTNNDTHFRGNRRKSFAGIPMAFAYSSDHTSIWQIYFIFMAVPKSSGSSWSMKYFKLWFLLEWNAASGNLAAQDFRAEAVVRIQNSSHSGQQLSLFSCLAHCARLKPVSTAIMSHSVEAKKNSTTAVEY